VGDILQVKVIAIADQDRVKLSRCSVAGAERLAARWRRRSWSAPREPWPWWRGGGRGGHYRGGGDQ